MDRKEVLGKLVEMVAKAGNALVLLHHVLFKSPWNLHR